MIKPVLFLSTCLIIIYSISSCKGTDTSPKRTFVNFFEDDFDNNIYWKYQNREYDSIAGASVFVDHEFNVSNSSASLNANQGEGCVVKRLVHEVQRADDLNYLINSDSLYVKLNIEKSFLGASGALSFNLIVDTNQIMVYIPEFDVNTTFEFKIHKWNVYETDNSQETLVWNYSKNTVEPNCFMIKASACGADLYADASITLNRIDVGYYDLLIAE